MHHDMKSGASLVGMAGPTRPRPLWTRRLRLLVSGYIAESPQAQVALASALGRDQSWVSRAANPADVRDPTAETIALVCSRWPEGRLSADYFFAPGADLVDRRAYIVRPRKAPAALELFVASAAQMGYGRVTPEEHELLAQQRWPAGTPTLKSYGDLLSALRACDPLQAGDEAHALAEPPARAAH